MKFAATKLPGVVVIDIEPQHDERGFFARSYCATTFKDAGLAFGTVRQTSVSHNTQRGSLRGMHWQADPSPEAKLVRVTAGRIFDVAIDLRPDSKTYRQWLGLELDAQRQNALLVPPGCAHGFVTLVEDCLVSYTMDADYDAGAARGVRWNDPAFNIAWPIEPAVMSERDRTWPNYQPLDAPSS